MRAIRALSLLIGITGSLPLLAQANDSALARGAAAITEEDVKRHIFTIADDSMGGRNTPSPGLELTAQYIAAQFRKAGFAPGGDEGSFLQRYPIPAKRTERVSVKSHSLRDASGPTTVADSIASSNSAPNVIGILEGTDPELKHEYVIFSAHMDHLGMRPGMGEDSIFNGADDDGSGTVGVIELAEAFRAAPPSARSSC